MSHFVIRNATAKRAWIAKLDRTTIFVRYMTVIRPYMAVAPEMDFVHYVPNACLQVFTRFRVVRPRGRVIQHVVVLD